MGKGKNEKTLKRQLYEYSVRKWWVLTIIFSLLPLWFLILQFFGTGLCLMSENGKLTIKATVITWVVILVWVLFSIIKPWADNKNQTQMEEKYEALKEGSHISEQLLGGMTELEIFRAENYLKFVFEKCGRWELSNIIKPKERIKDVATAITSVVNNICGISKNNIGVSIAVEEDGKWRWEINRNSEYDLTLGELLKNPNTSFRQIIDKKAVCVFYPDKRVGVREGKYVEGKIDKDHNGEGSVYCKNISISDNGENRIRAVLSVTTYENQICDQDDEDSKEKFEKKIMPIFETRLKTELSLYFILKAVDVRSKQVKQKPAKQVKQKSARKRGKVQRGHFAPGGEVTATNFEANEE